MPPRVPHQRGKKRKQEKTSKKTVKKENGGGRTGLPRFLRTIDLEADAQTKLDLSRACTAALGTALRCETKRRTTNHAEVSWVLQIQIWIVQLRMVGQIAEGGDESCSEALGELDLFRNSEIEIPLRQATERAATAA